MHHVRPPSLLLSLSRSLLSTQVPCFLATAAFAPGYIIRARTLALSYFNQFVGLAQNLLEETDAQPSSSSSRYSGDIFLSRVAALGTAHADAEVREGLWERIWEQVQQSGLQQHGQQAMILIAVKVQAYCSGSWGGAEGAWAAAGSSSSRAAAAAAAGATASRALGNSSSAAGNAAASSAAAAAAALSMLLWVGCTLSIAF